MTSVWLRSLALIFGMAAMLLCLSAPAEASVPIATQPMATAAQMPGHMPCCPDNPAGQQRTCAAQCPVVPADNFVMALPLGSQRLDYDFTLSLRDGVLPGLDLPPPR